MNGKDLRVICVGIGEMGKIGVQTLLDHNASIVAAVDINESIIGKDVAECSGYPACGTLIEKDLKAAIERTHPNVAYFASASELDLLKDDFFLCAANHINVVTTGIEPYYPKQAAPALAAKLDQAFKDGGVSLFASGINDIFWSGIGMDIVGSAKRVDAIDFSNKLPLEGMGVGVAEEFQMNCVPDEFRKVMASADLAKDPSVGGPLLSLYVNAEILGLHVTDTKIDVEPLCAPEDLPMPQWDMVIKKGRMLGQSFNISMTTEEGIALTTSMIIKVLEKGEKPGTTWTVKGEPNLCVELGDIAGEITTASITINRIPDVVDAPAGLLTLADLQIRPTYHHGDWNNI